MFIDDISLPGVPLPEPFASRLSKCPRTFTEQLNIDNSCVDSIHITHSAYLHFLALSVHISFTFPSDNHMQPCAERLSSCNKASLLVPLLRIHDLINDVSLWPDNPIDDAIFNGILRLHVEWPLHILQHETRKHMSTRWCILDLPDA